MGSSRDDYEKEEQERERLRLMSRRRLLFLLGNLNRTHLPDKWRLHSNSNPVTNESVLEIKDSEKRVRAHIIAYSEEGFAIVRVYRDRYHYTLHEFKDETDVRKTLMVTLAALIVKGEI